MEEYKTEQESFWAGEFGDSYIERNSSDRLLNPKIVMWSRMLQSAHSISSVFELGCNIGLNLQAIHKLNPSINLNGIEINKIAAEQAKLLKIADIQRGSIIDKLSGPTVNLTFTAGVLIHINPNYLESVYDNLMSMSNRYVLVAEYYNPSPTTINYRGHSERLYKRDFAGDLIENYGLKLVDYGFFYKRDKWAPQDDITWFLLEK